MNNNNEYPPKFKKNKRSGYHNKENEPLEKIAPKKTTNDSPKRTVKNSIKKLLVVLFNMLKVLNVNPKNIQIMKIYKKK